MKIVEILPWWLLNENLCHFAATWHSTIASSSMNIVVVLLLLNIWPLHFAIASSLTITCCYSTFNCSALNTLLFDNSNNATIIVFGNFFKLVQHFKDGYFEYFNNNSAQRMQDEKGNKKTTIGATHLCNANSNHTKVMALINYK